MMQLWKHLWGGGWLREGWVPWADTLDLTPFPEAALPFLPLGLKSVHMGLFLENVSSGVSSHLDSGGPR